MRFFACILFLVLLNTAAAQDTTLPYWKEIHAFKTADSLQFPAPNQILFIGSSSFTMWKDVQQSFPGYKILNRAFGGSTLQDLILYRYEVIFPYQPKQIVIYCGENDFAANDTVTVETVFERFKTLFAFIRSKYKTVPVAYVSMKPSPARMHLLQKYRIANKQIEQFLQKDRLSSFINVFSKMLKPDGTLMDDIFLEDQLHMNQKGYAIWKGMIGPVLKK